MAASSTVESSALARSAASFRRCSAMRSARRLTPVSLLEVADQPVHDAPIEVLAAEVDVAVGGAHLEDAVRELHDRDVEGAAAEVVDRDVDRAAALVEAVGERGGGGLVDDAQHFEAGDPAGVAGGLALGVVEVGGHGDDRFLGFLAERLLGLDSQLAQQDARDLLRRQHLLADAHVGVAVLGADHGVGHGAARAVCTSGDSNLRPISRLMAKIVFSGLVTAWRLAMWPTSRSPSSVKATIEGVVWLPVRLGSTRGRRHALRRPRRNCWWCPDRCRESLPTPLLNRPGSPPARAGTARRRAGAARGYHLDRRAARAASRSPCRRRCSAHSAVVFAATGAALGRHRDLDHGRTQQAPMVPVSLLELLAHRRLGDPGSSKRTTASWIAGSNASPSAGDRSTPKRRSRSSVWRRIISTPALSRRTSRRR